MRKLRIGVSYSAEVDWLIYPGLLLFAFSNICSASLPAYGCSPFEVHGESDGFYVYYTK
jgi:hypothetical protein